MNRSLLTCLLLGLVYIRIGCTCFHHGHGHGPRHIWHHNRHDWNPTRSTAEVIEWFNNADGALKNICAATSKIQPFISYKDDGYILKYPVSTTDLNVDIQIKNTVLKTSVTNKNGQEVFTDVRVLPDILNFSEATWSFLKGNLTILIPYNVPLNSEFRASCGVVSNNVISVPLSVAPNFQYRLNPDTN